MPTVKDALGAAGKGREARKGEIMQLENVL